MAEAAKKKGWSTRDVIISVVVVVVVGALLVGRALYTPHRVPSGSMVPTIMVGEYVLAANAQRTNGAPEVRAGDIVFHNQADEPGRAFVRRVIALPGQRISFRDGVPIIDGVAVTQTPTDETGPEGERIMRETLGGRSYLVAYQSGDGQPDLRDTREWVVPQGQVFLIGDARDNSFDSRLQGAHPITMIQQVGGWIIYSPESGRAGRRME
jgi:signal peptidase I